MFMHHRLEFPIIFLDSIHIPTCMKYNMFDNDDNDVFVPVQDDLGIRASEHPEESTRESRSLMMEYLPGIDEDASYC